jgi:hypothetical protein
MAKVVAGGVAIVTPLVIPINHPDPAALTPAGEAVIVARHRYDLAWNLAASFSGNVREYRDAADELQEAERLSLMTQGWTFRSIDPRHPHAARA